jgi:septal ring factor EnvC (AmiA/AmiB activator)
MTAKFVSNQRPTGAPEAVIPFAPSAKTQPSVSAHEVDVAGQNVLALLHRAANMSDQDYNHVVDIAHKLSDQLEDAKERIRDLEADLKDYQARTDRAEKWLAEIAADIEQRFFSRANNPPQPASPVGPQKVAAHSVRLKNYDEQ